MQKRPADKFTDGTSVSNKMKKIISNGRKNRGFLYHRIAENKKYHFNNTEEAFFKNWDNLNMKGKNPKFMDLLFRDKHDKIKMTVRDRFVVATVIQWLGSNIGMCFLRDVMKDSGLEIVNAEKYLTTRRKAMYFTEENIIELVLANKIPNNELKILLDNGLISNECIKKTMVHGSLKSMKF